jgi:hypothetical protein
MRDAQVAAFLHLFARYGNALPPAAHVQHGPPVYYITLYGKDPSHAFLDDLAKRGRRVAPGSLFDRGRGRGYRLDTADWIDDATIEFTGGPLDEPGVPGDRVTFRARRESGRWSVTP